MKCVAILLATMVGLCAGHPFPGVNWWAGASLTRPLVSLTSLGGIAGVDTVAAAQANAAALMRGMRNGTLGGGVLVPAGQRFLMWPASMTGLTNVTLRVEGTLALPASHTQWPNKTNTAMLYFEDCSGVTITGNGTFDGQGYNWWWASILRLIPPNSRPRFISSGSSLSHFLLEGVTMVNSPGENVHVTVSQAEMRGVTVWVDVFGDEPSPHPALASPPTWIPSARRSTTMPPTTLPKGPALHAALREGGQRGILRAAGHLQASGPEGHGIPTFPLNTDGLDAAGEYVWIHDTFVTNFDDSLCAKPLNAAEGGCTHDFVWTNNVIHLGVGLSMGSVPAQVGTNCITDVTVAGAVQVMPIKGIYIKSEQQHHGVGGKSLLARISYSNVTMTDAIWYPVYLGPQQQKQPSGGGSGWWPEAWPSATYANITLTDITATNTLWPGPGVLRANASSPVQGLEFDNVRITSAIWPADNFTWVCENAPGTAVGAVQPLPSCWD